MQAVDLEEGWISRSSSRRIRRRPASQPGVRSQPGSSAAYLLGGSARERGWRGGRSAARRRSPRGAAEIRMAAGMSCSRPRPTARAVARPAQPARIRDGAGGPASSRPGHPPRFPPGIHDRHPVGEPATDAEIVRHQQSAVPYGGAVAQRPGSGLDVTSSAVVGSSAISSRGLSASAIAIMTRWAWPPKLVRIGERLLLRGRNADRAEQGDGAVHAPLPAQRSCWRSGRRTCPADAGTGFRQPGAAGR